MKQSRQKRNGFSLVELVVVVLVMGIIAAVAGPKMFDTAGDARANGTKQSLSVVRDAIELHKAQVGAYPGDGGDEADLKADLTPFLRGAFPKVEIGANKNNNVRVATAGTALTATGTEGWAYDNSTGEFVINDATYLAW